MQYKGIFASSQDPEKLSLTVSSVTQAVIGLVGLFALSKGLDPAAATSQVQGIIELGTQVMVAAYTVFHGLQTVWGLVRKLYALFFTAPTV